MVLIPHNALQHSILYYFIISLGYILNQAIIIDPREEVPIDPMPNA